MSSYKLRGHALLVFQLTQHILVLLLQSFVFSNEGLLLVFLLLLHAVHQDRVPSRLEPLQLFPFHLSPLVDQFPSLHFDVADLNKCRLYQLLLLFPDQHQLSNIPVF